MELATQPFSQDVRSIAGLRNALKWLETARTLDLFHGNGEGKPDEAEILIGELRRVMLAETVRREITRKTIGATGK